MNGLPQFDFGLLIAYFFPGFVSFYALSYLSPRIARLFENLHSESQVGASLLLLVGSLVVGMIVSSLRSLSLDVLHDKTGAEFEPIDYSLIKDKEKWEVFQNILTNTYRFYQFHGNMVIALAFLAIVRWPFVNFSESKSLIVHALNIAAVVVMFLASRNSRSGASETLASILEGFKNGGEQKTEQDGV